MPAFCLLVIPHSMYAHLWFAKCMHCILSVWALLATGYRKGGIPSSTDYVCDIAQLGKGGSLTPKLPQGVNFLLGSSWGFE